MFNRDDPAFSREEECFLVGAFDWADERAGREPIRTDPWAQEVDRRNAARSQEATQRNTVRINARMNNLLRG